MPKEVNKLSDWVIVGRFGRVHGLKGFIKVYSFTEPLENILDYTDWHVGICGQWQPIEIIKTEINNKFIIAQIAGYSEREQAAKLTNLDIAVKQTQLPLLEAGEYYWYELIDMQVVNQQGVNLGKVIEILPTGANDVLVVAGESKHLIPYLQNDTVLKINRSLRQITVDWDANF